MVPGSSSYNTTVNSGAASDGLQNYQMLEQIGKGGRSTVYVAVCKRGRLRNRKVAIKKFSPSSCDDIASAASNTVYTSILHQALHHPSIVSLFSTFSASGFRYHVLELCSQGNLLDFLKLKYPHTLSEGQLRGVSRSLTDGLTYLRKERILHRNISPSNILITHDYRIKLGDFGLAVRLPTVNSTCSTFCGSPNYVSPEIVARVPYSFPTDLWSLGCVMLTCLTGTPPFEADSVIDIHDNISRAAYKMPETISHHVKDLVSSLLQVDSGRRIQLHSIAAHPFFDSSLSTEPLSQKKMGSLESSAPEKTHPIQQENVPLFPKAKITESRQRLSERMSISKPAEARDDENVFVFRQPLVDKHNIADGIQNPDLRRILRDEIKLRKKPHFPQTGRRVFSAPQPVKISPLGSSSSGPKARRPRATSLVSLSSSVAHIRPSPASLVDRRIEQHSPAAPKDGESPVDDSPLSAVDNNMGPGSQSSSLQRLRNTQLNKANRDDGYTYQRDSLPAKLPGFDLEDTPIVAVHPTGSRPVPITTAHIKPQTHKLASGQIMILPSGSMLVDLREGDRRKGRNGDEVLVIEADGRTIKVYSAPHLSTPCCLAEPSAVYAIENLPRAYWKQYNDAGRLLQQLKVRTPKLVIFETDALCTLMANEPVGDIEVIFPPPETPHYRNRQQRGTVRNGKSEIPNMRIRFSRQRRSMEIARYMPGVRLGKEGGEWTKKVFATPSGSKVLETSDWNSLELVEQDGVKLVTQFLQVCSAVEDISPKSTALAVTAALPGHESPTDAMSVFAAGKSGHEDVIKSMQLRHQVPSTCATQESTPDLSSDSGRDSPPLPSSSTATRTTLAIDICQRSAKLSHAFKQNSEKGAPRLRNERANTLSKALDAESTKPFQTRFIPSVGWCMRHENSGSAPGRYERYRLMFLDGVTLEIDVYEQSAQLIDQCGNTIIQRLEDRTGPIAERMKIFEDFVSLFDADL